MAKILHLVTQLSSCAWTFFPFHFKSLLHNAHRTLACSMLTCCRHSHWHYMTIYLPQENWNGYSGRNKSKSSEPSNVRNSGGSGQIKGYWQLPIVKAHLWKSLISREVHRVSYLLTHPHWLKWPYNSYKWTNVPEKTKTKKPWKKMQEDFGQKKENKSCDSALVHAAFWNNPHCWGMQPPNLYFQAWILMETLPGKIC